MNVEDGYDLPLRLTFEEEGGDPEGSAWRTG